MGKEGIDPQLAELQIRFHTEQGRSTIDQRVAGRHADITGFQRFDDLVLFSRIGQFQLFRVEVERGLGIVVHAEVDFRADGSLHVQLHALVKVEEGPFTLTFGEGRILLVGHFHAHGEFG